MVLIPTPPGWRLLSDSCTNTGMMRHFLCSQIVHKDSPLMCSLMDLLRFFHSLPAPIKDPPQTISTLLAGMFNTVHKFPVFHS